MKALFFIMKNLAVIPAYNAAESIAEVIEGLKKAGFDNDSILVVDDGSRDSTSRVAEESDVLVIRHEQNLGKGAALKTGFSYAIEKSFDAVLTLDSDMQHPPSLAPKFVEMQRETRADIVLGNRLSDLSDMPLHRRFSNLTTTFFVRLWTRAEIRDSQCGYRLIRTDILKKLDLRTNYYQAETELILEAARHNAIFANMQVPTIYNDYESKMKPFTETFRFIGIMLSHPFRRRGK